MFKWQLDSIIKHTVGPWCVTFRSATGYRVFFFTRKKYEADGYVNFVADMYGGFGHETKIVKLFLGIPIEKVKVDGE